MLRIPLSRSTLLPLVGSSWDIPSPGWYFYPGSASPSFSLRDCLPIALAWPPHFGFTLLLRLSMTHPLSLQTCDVPYMYFHDRNPTLYLMDDVQDFLLLWILSGVVCDISFRRSAPSIYLSMTGYLFSSEHPDGDFSIPLFLL